MKLRVRVFRTEGYRYLEFTLLSVKIAFASEDDDDISNRV